MLCTSLLSALVSLQDPTPPVEAATTTSTSTAAAEKTDAEIKMEAVLYKFAKDLQEKQDELDKKNKEVATTSAEKQKLENDRTQLADEIDKLKSDKVLLEQLKEELSKNVTDLSDQEKQINEILKQLKAQSVAAVQEKIMVTVNGTEIRPGGTTGKISGKRDKCHVTIEAKGTYVSLAHAGVKGIRIVGEDGAPVPLKEDILSLNSNTITLEYSTFCRSIAGSLTHGDIIAIAISMEGSPQPYRYTMEYKSPIAQFDLGIGMYFGGGGSKGQMGALTKQSFTIFPAFRMGVRLNVLNNSSRYRDFFIQPSFLVGGGFVVFQKMKTANEMTGQTQVSDDPKAKRFTAFLGGSLAIGKYLEVGWGYDFLNKSHLLLISPGALLSASIFNSGF